MGAEFVSEYFKKPVSHQQLKAEFEAMQDSCRHDFGHAGYTGTFAEASGLTILTIQFASEQDAIAFLKTSCQKWENALAVSLTNGDYIIGAWCAS